MEKSKASLSAEKAIEETVLPIFSCKYLQHWFKNIPGELIIETKITLGREKSKNATLDLPD